MPSSCGALLEGGLQAHVVERVILCQDCFAAAGATEYEIGELLFETHCGEYIEPQPEPEPAQVAPRDFMGVPSALPPDIPLEIGLAAEAVAVSLESLADIMDDAVPALLLLIERAYAAGQRKGL